MTIKDTILWWGAVIMLVALLTAFGISQVDDSPTFHPPTTSAVAETGGTP